MTRKFLITFILMLIFSGICLASAGSSSFAFLRLGSGSRPAALAEAVTASGVDITSAFYNPALLNSFDGKNQVVFMHNSYFSDVTENYLALASRGEQAAMGGYLILGKVSDFERRTGPDPEPSGTFDENNFVGALTYTRGIDNIDLGVTFKYAFEKIDYASASAVMFDLGLYMPLTDEISVGGAVKNIGTKPKFQRDAFELPREIRVGTAYKPNYFQQRLVFLGDGVFYPDIDTKFNLGAEYTLGQYYALRAGYGAGYDSRGLSFGGGLFYRQFKFDYAFVNYKNDLGNAHRFTLVATF
ncbi:MAG: PorV/PorQ family protein [candidate division Zixibacteria bacterium]|nr:PorV/PorQ family protein [candidate division Zixibacteria bacterium]